jgi:hypothetical protein
MSGKLEVGGWETNMQAIMIRKIITVELGYNVMKGTEYFVSL